VEVGYRMNWNIFYPVAICILTVAGAALAGHLAAKEWWHKWVFWGTAIVIILLTYFQARSIKEPPTAAEVAEAVATKLQNRPSQDPPANPKTNELADEIAKKIRDVQASDNKQICTRAFAVSKLLRDIEAEADTRRKANGTVSTHAQIDGADRISTDESARLKQIYGEVMFVYGEMRARLNTVPKMPLQAGPILQSGFIAGVDSLSSTASYLEVLAKKLCPEN
jgi:hypothetical protein